MGNTPRVRAALLALVCLWPAFAMAQDGPGLKAGDYALENRGWNGLSELVRMASEEGIELRPVTSVNFNTLGPSDRIIAVFPTRELPRKQLARFVVDGGKVLLADDFGASSGFIERLGIERRDGAEIRHERFFLNQPGLPLFQPGGKHPLLDGVEEVVANHPSALKTEGGAILPFGDPEYGLVYDMRLGRGKAIVMGDASLLINHMLEVRDNRRFVQNALTYLCRGIEDCRPLLVVGDVSMLGNYKPKNAQDEDLGELLGEGLSSLNAFLEDLATYIPNKNAVYYASLLLMVGLIVFMITVFTWRRPAGVAPEAGPPDHVRPLSEFEWNLLRYEHGGVGANYALPMAILKTEFERLFYKALAGGEAIPAQDDSRRGAFLRRMAQTFVERHHGGLAGRQRAKVYKQTLQLLKLFSRIPPRHRLFLDSEAYFSERELMRVYSRSRAILERMGLDEDYEQRTRRGRRPRA